MTRRSPIVAFSGALALAVVLAGSCKTFQAASGVKAEQSTKAPQCQPGGALKGVCQVVEVTGRLGVSTEAARASFAGEIVEMRIGVPLGDKDVHAEVQFFRKTGAMDELTIADAMDLYGRHGCIGEVNGGVVGEGFTPRVTLHALFNHQDDARSGYAEVSDYRSGKALHATLGLKCDWK